MKFNSRVFAVAIVAVTLSATPLLAAPAEFAMPATPLGVTVQPASPAGYDGTGASGPYFGTAEGMTLYTFDSDPIGQSVCNGECAAAWPPLAASDGAATTGEWSVIARDDGTKQWAFRGKPLYSFVKDEKIGDKNGVGVADLWRKAELNPGANLKFPIGTAIRDVFNAGGQVLVNAEELTLYTFSEDPKGGQPACVGACTDTWMPHLAPTIANPVGEFSIVRREDGIDQWAFRGKPLYTFSGDYEPELALGSRADERFQSAMLARYFMPGNVVINESARHGAMLTTVDGYPLYAKDANRFTGGGASHAGRSIARGSVTMGRQIGLAGCDADCEKTWVPFLAADDDRSTGYWNTIARPDGKRQWAYLGYAMYTYTADEPGTIRGHDIYDLSGKVPNFKGPSVSAGAQALYWRVALP
jgi:predicted lipoprotein with Yx(FWY)xxD motif